MSRLGTCFAATYDDNTPLGNQAKSYMDSGELVPDELTVAMIADRLAEADAADGFLLDGFPRNLRQAEQLAVTLRQSGHAVDSVVEMRLDRDEVVRRLAGRRVCSDCRRSWHIEFEPPRVPGICDGCAGELHQRDDDHEESIRRRLELYDEQTAPVVAFYHAQRVLIPVDAGGSVESVGERMIAALAG